MNARKVRGSTLGKELELRASSLQPVFAESARVLPEELGEQISGRRDRVVAIVKAAERVRGRGNPAKRMGRVAHVSLDVKREGPGKAGGHELVGVPRCWMRDAP